MKVTRIYVYPIKALRPWSVTTTQLARQGFEYDRRFMLLKVKDDGGFKNVQTVFFPECTRLFQEIDGDEVVVTYNAPEEPLIPATPEQSTALRIPLHPDVEGLETVDIALMNSKATAYRMGHEFNSWFSSCLGYETILVYLGDGKRPVLAHSPSTKNEVAAAAAAAASQPQQKGGLSSWLLPSLVTSYVYGSPQQKTTTTDERSKEPDWLTFNEAAPLLVTSEASLRDVSSRLPPPPEAANGGDTADARETMEMDLMMRFRPNIVVDGTDAWDEDFWGELLLVGGGGGGGDGGGGDNDDKPPREIRLALTANCGRCGSINIDYNTGRPADGEMGTVLKKLMRDRRVDTGIKWTPIFGRYAFPLLLPVGATATATSAAAQQTGRAEVAVGDEVRVVKRIQERDVWSWPM